MTGADRDAAYYRLPDWLEGVPVACLACGKLHPQALGIDIDEDLVCPGCESVDVVTCEPADGIVLAPAACPHCGGLIA